MLQYQQARLQVGEKHSLTMVSDINSGSVSGGAANTPTESIRTRRVVVYLLLAAVVLVPGVLLRFGIDGLVPGLQPAFAVLQSHLVDIRFGGGLRFWLGVTGFSMMALLLLYPVRKWLGTGGVIGRVAGWFHWHILFGIAGPVAIGYHTNFGHGALHANLALWAMIVVVLSGLVGHFVYTRASAEFYRGKLRAREQVGAIIGLLNGLDAMHPSRAKLIADLEVFEREMLTPRRGVFASLSARLRLEGRQRTLARALGWHLGECAAQLHLDEATHAELRETMARHLAAFVSLARHGATRSVSEQLLARWRLLHLPVFLIMLVATFLHVRNVWDMDAIVMTRAPTLAVRPPLPIAPTPIEIKRPQPSVPAPVAGPRPAEAQAPVSLPTTRNGAAASDSATREASAVPRAVRGPQPVPTPSKVEPAQTGAQKPVAAPPAPAPMSISPLGSAPADNQRPTTPQRSVIATKDPTDDLAVQAQRMGLGGKPRTLVEQIVAYKALKQAGRFSHSDAETAFALSGKHVKLDCASCHTAPLREGRPAKARACIDCHKEDDVHRGRRPNCAQCHTPNTWGEIIRRR